MFEINQVLENMTITKMAAGGEGIARFENFVIFVKYVCLGDVLNIKITELAKRFARAEIVEIIKPSKHRIDPKCKYYEKCGGCNFMHLTYDAQLEYKENFIKTLLFKIGGISEDEYLWQGIEASPLEFRYRNKLQVPVDGYKIGFYAQKSHDVIDVKTCIIEPEILDKILQKLREYDISSLRHICMRINKKNEVLLTFVGKNKLNDNIRNIAESMVKTFGSEIIKGVLFNQNKDLKNNFVFGSDKFELICGNDEITEKLGAIQYSISSNSFFQVNSEIGEKLYEYIKQNLEVDETVLDLYCGGGGISLFIAQKVKKVIGVEVVKKAIEKARDSARLNNIENIEFFEGTVEQFLSKILNDKSSLGRDFDFKINTLILNPPRKGINEKIVDEIFKIMPEKIIYVSCNPATLARDLKRIKDGGYKVSTVKAFDMFPQTSNVETVVKLDISSKI